MASLNMEGSYLLTKGTIDEKVKRERIGNYALGYTRDSTFIVRYVGRSDTDINLRLKDWEKEYKEFKFSYASSVKEAFEKECKNYHDFGEAVDLENSIHPQRPEEKVWKCPYCNAFG